MLGTYVELYLEADKSDNDLMQISEFAFDEINRIERIMSFHDRTSELSYINQNAHKKCCAISIELEEVIARSLDISKQSNGLFDITIADDMIKAGLLPMQKTDTVITISASFKDIILPGDQTIAFKQPLLIDLGGIAKGYAVDKAYQKIVDHVDDVVINAGGDLKHKCWQNKSVLIQTNNEDVIPITMHAPAQATSSWYYQDNQKAAIMNPIRKFFSQTKQTVSVCAKECMTADALTKLCFLMDNPEDILQNFGAKALYFDSNNQQIWRS